VKPDSRLGVQVKRSGVHPSTLFRTRLLEMKRCSERRLLAELGCAGHGVELAQRKKPAKPFWFHSITVFEI